MEPVEGHCTILQAGAAKMDREAGPSLEDAMANNMSASSICVVCQGIGEEGHPRGRLLLNYQKDDNPDSPHLYTYVHYPNVVLLSESARKGCRVCALLIRALEFESSFEEVWAESEEHSARENAFDVYRDTDEVDRLLEDIEIPWYRDERLRPGRIVLFADCKNSKGPRDKDVKWRSLFRVQAVRTFLVCNIYYLDALLDPLDPGVLQSPAQDLLSESHIALVRRWMGMCATKHQTCRGYLERVPELPTRVLDISSDLATGEVTGVRLVEPRGCKEQYACLSYCWGQSGQASKTITTNLGQHLKSIPLDGLPKTITDSLKLSCKLGFRYIWVDSLCIIQDDHDDWLKEASNMAEIYSSSNLTLAIHLCEDSSESFLQKRQQRDPQFSKEDNARVVYTDQITGIERVLHLWMLDSGDGVRFLEGEEEGQSSWLTRAWTFQEWLLSPRVLHVHNTTVWDCSECYGNETDHRFLSANPLVRAPSWLATNIDWCYIVVEFTRRNIKSDMDRLPALAGLAKKYSKVTGHKYLAGLWLEGLPMTLLWSRDSIHGDSKSPTAYRAPSWSWASLESPVSFSSSVDDIRITTSIISAHCEYYPPGALSTVTSGWLDVEGPICSVTRDESRTYGLSLIAGFKGPTWIAILDDDSCSEEFFKSKVYLLGITERRTQAGHGIGHALILQKEGQDGGNNVFRRIGLAFEDRKSRSEVTCWPRETIRLV